MQIEQIEINGSNFVFVHFDTNKEDYRNVSSTIDVIAAATQAVVIPVPDGKPIPRNELSVSSVILINETNEGLISAMKKISMDTTPGRIISLTDDEYKAINSGDITRF